MPPRATPSASAPAPLDRRAHLGERLHRRTLDGDDPVARPQPRLLGRHPRDEFADAGREGRLGVEHVGIQHLVARHRDRQRQLRVPAPHDERNGPPAGKGRRHRDVVPRLDGASVDGEDAVAFLQTALLRRSARRHGAHDGRRLAEARPGREGQQEREHDGEDDVAEGPREGDDDALPRADFLERGALLRAALQGVRPLGVELRQGHVAAEGNRGDAVLHAADGLLPEGGAEPDRETVHAQAEDAGREEVAELVDEDREREEEDTRDNGEDSG